jgi:hypothetical protein
VTNNHRLQTRILTEEDEDEDEEEEAEEKNQIKTICLPSFEGETYLLRINNEYNTIQKNTNQFTLV